MLIPCCMTKLNPPHDQCIIHVASYIDTNIQIAASLADCKYETDHRQFNSSFGLPVKRKQQSQNIFFLKCSAKNKRHRPLGARSEAILSHTTECLVWLCLLLIFGRQHQPLVIKLQKRAARKPLVPRITTLQHEFNFFLLKKKKN